MVTLLEENYQTGFQNCPNIMSLINFTYNSDTNNFKYKKTEVNELITEINTLSNQIQSVKLPEKGELGGESDLGGGGRKRSHKKIPYGLISSKKKQKKNSLKNNYQNSIIKTKKI